MRPTRLILPAALGLALLIGPPALAAGNFGLSDAARSAGLSTSGTLPSLIGNIIKVALGFVGTIFLLLTLFAGFKWMTARGDAKAIDEAKKMITGAVTGILLIAAAYAITSFVLAAASGTSGADGGAQEIADGTVSTGGTCIASADCATVTDVCENSRCVSSLE